MQYEIAIAILGIPLAYLENFICLYISINWLICNYFVMFVIKDTKNHFQKAQKGGKKGCSLAAIPHQMVPKYGEKSMQELPVYLV